LVCHWLHVLLSKHDCRQSTDRIECHMEAPTVTHCARTRLPCLWAALTICADGFLGPSRSSGGAMPLR
jgi:hypothetical protein